MQFFRGGQQPCGLDRGVGGREGISRGASASPLQRGGAHVREKDAQPEWRVRLLYTEGKFGGFVPDGVKLLVCEPGDVHPSRGKPKELNCCPLVASEV